MSDLINTYSMKMVAPTVSRILGINVPSQAKEEPIMQIIDDLSNIKGVAVLAIDALGYKAYEKFKHLMPCMTSIISHSGNFAYLKSILPSITPVNFACMVTGVEADVHGIGARNDNFICEHLFDILRENGKKSAGLGRKGYTGNELLGRYGDYSTKGCATNDDEVETIFMKIVKDKMPEFIIVQYGLVDDISHAFGPYSRQAGEAIAKSDGWLSRCITELRKHEYGIIILADHGQHEFKKADGTVGGTHGEDISEDCIVPLTWTK